MSAFRLACVAMLVTWAVVETCLAGTVQQDGAARVYSTVDDDGVTLFTNIPPAGGALASGVEPAASQARTRSTQAPANDSVSHVMVHAAKLQAPSRTELQADSGADEAALDEIPPQLRDGGPPPDDHSSSMQEHLPEQGDRQDL